MEIIKSEATVDVACTVYDAIRYAIDTANRAGEVIESIELTVEEGAELCTYLAHFGLATITVDDLSDPEKEVRPYGGVRVVVA